MSKTILCPCCGKMTVFETIKDKYPCIIGKGSAYCSLEYSKCTNCESEFDFNHKNDKIMKKGVSDALQDCAINILKEFVKDGRSFSEIERLFYLPQHTLSKWKNSVKKPSAAAVMLLRLLDLYPWLENVAEENFDPEFSENFISNYYLQKFNSEDKSIIYISTYKNNYAIAKVGKKKFIKSRNNNSTNELNLDNNLFLDFYQKGGAYEY